MPFNLAAAKDVGGFNPAAAKAVVMPGSREAVEENAPDWTKTALEVPGALAQNIGGVASWLGNQIADLPEHPLGYKLINAAKALPGAMAKEYGGQLQYFRNMSPPEFRGSMPTFEGGEAANHPYFEAAQGHGAGLRTALATVPLGVAADVLGAASTVSSPVRETLLHGAEAVASVPGRAVNKGLELTGQRRAERALLEAAGNDPEALARALESRPTNVPGVPLSGGQTSLHPQLMGLERTSRQRSGPLWMDFDTSQNTGLVNALRGVVNPFDEEAITAARTARSAATDRTRETALRLAEQGSLEHGALPDPLERLIAPVRNTISEGLEGRAGGVAGAQKTADYVLDRTMQGTEPAARLYEKRKFLADALNAKTGVPLSEQAAAAKSAGAFTREIKNSIDTSLDQASGGMWREYLDAFREHSAGVNSAEALNKIRLDLERAIEGGRMADTQGNPILSRATINNMIEKHARNKYGETIAPEIRARLDDIKGAAARIETGKNALRLAQTGGAGSDSVANLTEAIMGHGAGVLGLGHLVRGALALKRGVGGIGESRGATRLAELLQNPPQAAQALRTAAERRRANELARALRTQP